ncbi:helix-turn-helix domain-containing protein [Deinococcus peraridilitoris]|uniref:helix-turn-helix domain-containing protein n=1 Tax=Deinococcus peraridilitoris TaxID=432329 RepID=UPI001FDFC9FC|nr:helix-turn-helix transcriptional regulator [Deinococcus peraridilitoris]
MRTIEQELLEQIKQVMRQSGKTQADFAAHQETSRQAVNPYFSGKKSLLTETGKDLLDFLGVSIQLIPKGDKQ